MYKIDGTTITLTKGDSFWCVLDLKKNGTAYVPAEGDVIRFAVKKHYSSEAVLIEKTIPTDTLQLHLLPEDTKHLQTGEYVCDFELTDADGEVDTFISEAKLVLTPEVK